MLYIPLPSAEERGLIMLTLARNKPLSHEVDAAAIAIQQCKGFSGADLSALMREAAANALKVRKASLLVCFDADRSASSRWRQGRTGEILFCQD